MQKLMKVVVTALMGWSAVVSAANFKVSQQSQAFSVSSLSLKVGDTVDFSNEDTVAHNIYSLSGEPFDLGMMKPAQSKSYTFKKAGTYEVECAIHPNMKMTVTVK